MTVKSFETRRVRLYDVNFWFYTFGLILVWITVYATAAPAASEIILLSTSTPASRIAPPLLGEEKDKIPRQEPNVITVGSKDAKKEQNTKKPDDDEEKRNTGNCKALCQHCGCLGFYCGEECICECNNENSDTECIATMQSNARKLDIPFEILIQGPSSNRFVRNAFQYAAEPDWDAPQVDSKAGDDAQNEPGNANYDPSQASAQKATLGRNKRSTVRIYKPTAQNSIDLQVNRNIGYVDAASSMKQQLFKNGANLRQKRSVKQMEWFTDLTNSLVRPAPLNGLRRRSDNSNREGTSVQSKRSPSEMDRSWFADNSNRALRPAPLFRRQRFSMRRENNNRDNNNRDNNNRDNNNRDNNYRDNNNRDNNNRDNNYNSQYADNDDDDSNRDMREAFPRRAVEQIPKALEQTWRSMQETAMNNADNGGDFISTVASNIADGKLGERLRSRIEEGASAFQNHLDEANMDFLPAPETVRENIQQTLSNLRSQMLSRDERPLAPFMSAVRDSLAMGRSALTQQPSPPPTRSLDPIPPLSSSPSSSLSSSSSSILSQATNTSNRSARSQSKSAPIKSSRGVASTPLRNPLIWLRPGRFLQRVQQSFE